MNSKPWLFPGIFIFLSVTKFENQCDFAYYSNS
jgi:hypothetical protein